MALVTANQFQLTPDLSQAVTGFQQGQQIASQFHQAQQQRDAAKIKTQLGQFSGQALGGDKAALNQVGKIDPNQAIQIQKFLANQSEADRAEGLRENEALTRTSFSALSLIDPIERRQFLEQKSKEFKASGRDTTNIDTALQGNDAQLEQSLNLQAQQGLTIQQLAERQFPDSKSTADQREFIALSKKAGLSDKEITKAIKVKFGLEPRAGSSAAERIAFDNNLAESVAKTQASIEGSKASAKEEGKLNVQGRLLPKIRGAIKQAEKEATARGEKLTALNKAKAALPSLKEVSSKLKSLADVATFTTSGKAINLLSKELGFGATKGATARASMTAIVDNQVLPLLRDTFGAAFTENEGKSLKATILDKDATPEEKKATLDAFIDQKIRDIEVGKRELGLNDLSKLSDAELQQQIEEAKAAQ